MDANPKKMRQEMRANFDAHHEKMIAELRDGHEETMTKTGSLASKLRQKPVSKT
jgi:hypothetical protein